MIFLAKTNSTNGVLTMTEAQLAENAVKLRDAEYKFYKSIYPNIVRSKKVDWFRFLCVVS
jgi:hypothetical protein